MSYPRVGFELPGWVEDLVSETGEFYPKREERMRLAIELSHLNAERDTGGPFGAAIFEAESGRLLAPGVNLVTTSNLSTAHAEMVAIMVAQQVVGSFDLGEERFPAYELVASTEPCAMCFGATPWSGVRSLVCGGRDEDARSIGFDEGPKMEDWPSALRERGISVERDVLREEAASVLRGYAESGGVIYNARRG